jgi:polyhydroxybutyrate depolymerase
MIKQRIIIICLATILLVSCASSHQAIHTAISGTQAAWTPVPTETIDPTHTAYPTSTSEHILQPGLNKRSLMVGSLERNYLLYIPPDFDSEQPVPVLFVFHGYAMVAGDMWDWGFNEVADKEGILVAYPNGINTSWNASRCCGDAVKNNIDDIAFVRQMLSDLGAFFRIDPKRIFASGFSNGAMFLYRLACEMSDTFGAIAPVVGYLLTDPCQPQQPVSVMEVHGLDDNYYGAYWTSANTRGNTDAVLPPVEQTMATWVSLNGCTGSPQVEELGRITHTFYDTCKAGSAVELDAVEGLGHRLPNPDEFPTLSPQGIWNFLKAHPKP